MIRKILLRISHYAVKFDSYLWSKLHGRKRDN